MQANSDFETRERTGDREFDRYVSYPDGDGTVVCDRRNPSAWIRSTAVRQCRR